MLFRSIACGAAAQIAPVVPDVTLDCPDLRRGRGPGLAVRGEGVGLEHRLPGNVNISFPGLEGETILLDLDMHGICASTGSACNSDSLDPSHVLLSIGVPEEIGHGSMRFTFGPQNTMEEAKYLCDVLEEVIPRRRAMSCMWLQGQNKARQFSLKGEQ